MVFESYVVDLLNKFAGQYLENLDSSQLRIGIWGGGSIVASCTSFCLDRVLNLLFLKQYLLTFTGDVQLENLILKESALVSLFVQFACLARSWSVSLRKLHVGVLCSS